MPSKATQKKKKDEDGDNLGLKFIVVLFFIALLGFSYFILSQKKDQPKKPPRARAAILGEETGNPVRDLADLGRQTEQAVISTTEEVKEVTGQVLGAVASSAATFVVENAGESLFNQIRNLPPQQQEEIRQQICR